jgi:hypothetical protein
MPAHRARRLRILATLVLAASVGLGRTAAAQELLIAPKLRAGDTFRLEIAKSRQESMKPTETARSTTIVDVQVVSASPDGTTLDWSQGETTFGDGRTSPDLIVHAAAVALAGLRLRIGLNADGDVEGLVNAREVMPKLEAASGLMLQGIADTIPEHDRKAFQALMAQVLSPAVLLVASTSDARTYFSLNGVAMTAGEVIETDLDQPNPLGGGTIPSRFRIKAESATEDAAVFVTSTTYDGEAFAQMTLGLIEKAGKILTPEEVATFVTPQMQDEGRFVLDRPTGLIREMSVRRRISNGAMQRVDTWDIRLVQPPKR